MKTSEKKNLELVVTDGTPANHADIFGISSRMSDVILKEIIYFLMYAVYLLRVDIPEFRMLPMMYRLADGTLHIQTRLDADVIPEGAETCGAYYDDAGILYISEYGIVPCPVISARRYTAAELLFILVREARFAWQEKYASDLLPLDGDADAFALAFIVFGTRYKGADIPTLAIDQAGVLTSDFCCRTWLAGKLAVLYGLADMTDGDAAALCCREILEQAWGYCAPQE